MHIERVLIKCLDDFDASDAKDVEQFISTIIGEHRRTPHINFGPETNSIAISSSRMRSHDVDDFLRIFEILEHDKVFDFIMNENDEYLYEWLHKDNIRKVVPYHLGRVAKMLIHEATWSKKADCWYVVLNEPIFSNDKWYIV